MTLFFAFDRCEGLESYDDRDAADQRASFHNIKRQVHQDCKRYIVTSKKRLVKAFFITKCVFITW